jgi:hypothetical protein
MVRTAPTSACRIARLASTSTMTASRTARAGDHNLGSGNDGLREGRVIRQLALQAQAAEPAIGQVQKHFLAEPALRANAEAIADEQHPDHQLRVDRRTSDLAVEGPQVSAHAGQVDEPIDRTQQVIGRNVPFE